MWRLGFPFSLRHTKKGGLFKEYTLYIELYDYAIEYRYIECTKWDTFVFYRLKKKTLLATFIFVNVKVSINCNSLIWPLFLFPLLSLTIRISYIVQSSDASTIDKSGDTLTVVFSLFVICNGNALIIQLEIS